MANSPGGTKHVFAEEEAWFEVASRSDQIEEIVRFVTRHAESQATRAVFSRILGRHDMEVSAESLRELKDGLDKATSDEVESLYYIVR